MPHRIPAASFQVARTPLASRAGMRLQFKQSGSADQSHRPAHGCTSAQRRRVQVLTSRLGCMQTLPCCNLRRAPWRTKHNQTLRTAAEALLPSGGQPLLHILPVDDAPDGLEVVRPDVLVLEVVGVLEEGRGDQGIVSSSPLLTNGYVRKQSSPVAGRRYAVSQAIDPPAPWDTRPRAVTSWHMCAPPRRRRPTAARGPECVAGGARFSGAQHAAISGVPAEPGPQLACCPTDSRQARTVLARGSWLAQVEISSPPVALL